MSAFAIHPATRVGLVHLIVADLARSLPFYQEVLGFHLLEQAEGQVALTADGEHPLLLLTERPRARPAPARSSGLYHFAILFPDRRSLADSLWRLAKARYPLGGASDHGVSEALYLSDPDGNGIELYRDRPRESWPFEEGQLQMDTRPLDLQGLLQEVDGEATAHLPPGTIIGHVHLHVSHLEPAVQFYGQQIGLELMQYYGQAAAFLSAGGYHHHLGLNTWAGVGAPPPPAGTTGLRYFTLLLPDEEELARLAAHLAGSPAIVARWEGGLLLRDPSRNVLALLSDSSLAAVEAVTGALDRQE